MSTEETYRPRRGSHAEKAMTHLLEHGATAQGPLGEVLGVDMREVGAVLQHPIALGIFVSSKREGIRYWDIGTSARLPPEAMNVYAGVLHERIASFPAT